MKVSELIEQLSKLDPNLDVAIGYKLDPSQNIPDKHDHFIISRVANIESMAIIGTTIYDSDPPMEPTTVVLWDISSNED